MMRINKYTGVLFSLIINTCFALFWGCSDKKEEGGISDHIDSSVPVTEVEVFTAKRKPFQYRININGKVEAAKEVKLQLEVDGIIEKVNVKNGDIVSSGQVIAMLNNHRYKLDLSNAEIQLREKQISYEDQTIGFRHGDLDTLKKIRDNIHFTSGLAAAENTYEKAKFLYENTIIKSPINGAISNMILKDGGFAKMGDELCSVHNPNELLISCQILESDAFIIYSNNEATIQPLFDPQRKYIAHVVNINPRVDLKTGLVDIKLAVVNPTKLIPGMNVAVIVKVPTRNSIVVPKEAIVIRSGKQVVFTEEKGQAKWNYVILGKENGTEVEILEGLNENDKVIVSNNIQLAHEAPVKATPHQLN